MNIIFTKPTGKSLISSSKRHKTKKGGKYESQHESVWERNIHLARETAKKGNYSLIGQRKTKGSTCGVKLIWPRMTNFCPKTGISPVQKIQIRYLRNI